MSTKAKRRILVIDDDETLLETLEFALRDQGFDVVTADCGERALQAAAHGEFHAAVTDLKMPGMSGQETVVGFKRLHPTVPVIVMTGYAPVDGASETVRWGASGFLRKPFKLEQLLAMLS